MTKCKLRPFKGFHYNLDKVPNLSSVVTPPYDVITPEMQTNFYEKGPNNFIRVDLVKDPGDTKYEVAGKTYKQWIEDKILVQDETPGYYIHHHTFKLPNGQAITRKGLFGAKLIEDFSEGGIKPHEKTLEGPKADRLKLTRVVHANLSPIFSLYSDPQKNIDHLVSKLVSQDPLFDFTTEEGHRHELWLETNPTVCSFISEYVGGQPVFIADGHHRYETALNYRNECRQKAESFKGDEPFNYVMMYLSNKDDEGLIILPIHRALKNLNNLDLVKLIENLQRHMRVIPLGKKSNEEFSQIVTDEGIENHAFILITPDENESYLLSLKKRVWKSSPPALHLSPSLVDLDVTVLHRLILEEILRISPEAQAREENLIYWKDTIRAINETRNGACQMTFLLNPTHIEDMEKVAMAGEKMPQKSTFFYPKIISGLVIHSLVQ